MEQYFRCKLPTLYANGIPILHIIPDGRICIRSEIDTNLRELQKMGFQTENTKYKTALNYDSNYSMIKTISSTDLGVETMSIERNTFK